VCGYRGGKHVITYVLSPHVPLLSLPLSAISVMGDKENLKPLFPLPPPTPHPWGGVNDLAPQMSPGGWGGSHGFNEPGKPQT